MASDDSGVFEVPPLPADTPQSPPPAAAQGPMQPPLAPARANSPTIAAPASPTVPNSSDPDFSIPPRSSASQLSPQTEQASNSELAANEDDFAVPAVEETAVRLTGVLWSPPAPPAQPSPAPSREKTAARRDSVDSQPSAAARASAGPSRPPVKIPAHIDSASRRPMGRSITLSARKLDFPKSCACCGGSSDAAYDAVLRRGRGKDRVWSVPYCSNCLAHVKRTARVAAGAMTLGGVSGGALWIIWCAMGSPIVGLLVAAIAGVSVWGLALTQRRSAIRRSLAPGCAACGPAVRYENFRGTQHRIHFANSAYAGEFERLNEQKVVDLNSPGARQRR